MLRDEAPESIKSYFFTGLAMGVLMAVLFGRDSGDFATFVLVLLIWVVGLGFGFALFGMLREQARKRRFGRQDTEGMPEE